MKTKLKLILATCIIFAGIILFGFTSYASSWNLNDTRKIGIEYNLSGSTYHLWNEIDDYYVNGSSGIQLTNHYQDYWTRNIVCVGATEIGEKCANGLAWNWNQYTDNLTYAKLVGTASIRQGAYSADVTLEYYLSSNASEIKIIPTFNVIGKALTNVYLKWKITDMQINMNQYNNELYLWQNETINETVYNEETLQNETIIWQFNKEYHYNLSDSLNLDFNTTQVSERKIEAWKQDDWQFLRARWGENLTKNNVNSFMNFNIRVKHNGEYNAPVNITFFAGNLNKNDIINTTLYWVDQGSALKRYLSLTAVTNVGVTDYRNFTTATGTEDTTTTVKNAKLLNTFYFDPATGASQATGDSWSATPAGYGWATSYALPGQIPAGIWTFSVKTTASSATGTGKLGFTVFKYCGTTNTRLFTVYNTTLNVTITTSPQTFTTDTSQSAFAVDNCMLKVEYWLNMSIKGTSSTGAVTFTTVGSNEWLQFPEPSRVDYFNPQTNNSYPRPGDSINFTTNFTVTSMNSAVNLSQYIFESNISGVWANTTYSFPAGNKSVIATHVASANTPGFYGWRFYANDTQNNTNQTPMQTVTVATRTLVVTWQNGSQINSTLCPVGSPCQYSQYDLFNISANITCVTNPTGQSCGSITGGIMYNDSSATYLFVNTTAGGTPFYATGSSTINQINCSDLTNVGDASVVSTSPDTNYGMAPYDTVISYTGTKYRIWIKFDTSFNSSNHIVNNIINATLFLDYFSYVTNNPVGRTYNLYNTTDNTSFSTLPWWEGNRNNQICSPPDCLTWNNQTTTDTLQSSLTVPASFGWMQWSIGQAINASFNEGKNISLTLRDSDESSATTYGAQFYSKDTLDPDLYPPPYLTVCYNETVTTGPQNPSSIGTLNDGDSYLLNYTINASGSATQYFKLIYNFTSDLAVVPKNYTADAYVRIGADTTPPELTISSPTNTTYRYNTSLPLNYIVSDGALDKCWYKLDSGANTSIANCANTTFNAIDGTHTLYLFANDTSNNINNTKNVTFSVDTTCVYPDSGNWNINNAQTCSNRTITMTGNVIIQSNGNLTFRNVTLKMNLSFDGQYGITVQSGGAFYIYDNDNDKSTTNDASNITAVDTNYEFFFMVNSGSTFAMKNSLLSEAGSSSYPVSLKISTTVTEFSGNTLTNNYYGVVLYSNNNIITNNTANSNDRGIYLSSSSNNILTGNTANSNTNYGIYLEVSSNNTLTNNTANSNSYGIYLALYSNNNIINNNTANSNFDGIYLSSSSNSNLTQNSLSENLRDIFVTVSSNISYSYNEFKHNINSSMITLSTSNQTPAINDLVGFNISVFYPNGTACNSFTYNITTRPYETVNTSVNENNITGNFTATRLGLYSLIINVTDSDNNNVIRNYAFLVNTTTRTANYYFRAINPTHAQPAGSDAKSLLLTVPTTEETWTCAIWVQASPDDLAVPAPNVIKDINMSFWYKTVVSAYTGVQKYVTYENDMDYKQSVPSAGSYTWINRNFSVNWSMDYAKSWYWLSVKLNGSSPYWMTNSTNPSYVNISYLYSTTPEIKNNSNTDILILSATSPSTDTNNATIYLDGTGATNLTVQMPNTTIIYSVNFDGVTCNNENCTFTQSNGELNFTLTLVSEHNISISFTGQVTDTCTYSSGNWNINCDDDCNLTTNTDLGGNSVIFSGTGTVSITALITNFNIARASTGCHVIVRSGGKLQ